jgi:hypothetical protein
MDLSQRITSNDPWDEESEGSTLLSPPIGLSNWEQICLFPGSKDDDYAIEVDLTLLEGEVLNNQLYKEAGVILRYSGENQYYYAGLGGFGARTFIGKVTLQNGRSIWSLLDSQGKKEEIELNRTYSLRVECRGATITLSEIGKNRYFRYTVEDNTYPRGHGGLRTVRTQARFASLQKSGPSKLKVFVVMPLTTSLNFVYETIERVLAEHSDPELTCYRVDKLLTSIPIIEDIKKLLTTADLIIADLTDGNPNVYYEAGFAHALGKKVILIAQDGTDLKFNVRHIRIHFYKDPEDLRRKLKKAIDQTLAPERGR